MINIIGLGYIGLPTALMFAQSGIEVVGTDINTEIIERLNNGEVGIDENGMEELFRKAVENKISFTTEYKETDTYIITVPTPYDKSTKKIDTVYVMSAIESVLNVCLDNSIVIIESTISPGTIDKKVRPYINKYMEETGKTINIVHAPERIIPGNMVYELKHNSRTIGADNVDVAKKVKDLYASFCAAEIVLTDIKSAEMSKVVENTFRDINIAFANELAKLCREDNMDVYEIINIANRHPRVNILQPGPGVGGHCIPVDPWFLVGEYPEHTALIKQARNVNDSMPSYVINRVENIMTEFNIGSYSKVGFYGLTYKENIDDIRESPTLQIVKELERRGIKGYSVYDPHISDIITVGQVNDFESFYNNVDIIVIMVAHSLLFKQMSNFDEKIILDTKNVLKSNNTLKL